MSHARTTSISLRIAPDRLSMIDRAAESRGQTRTDFILQNAEAAAAEAILDQTVFRLSEDAFEAFKTALDSAGSGNPALAALRRRKPIWS